VLPVLFGILTFSSVTPKCNKIDITRILVVEEVCNSTSSTLNIADMTCFN